jgi:FG-GAP repeat protein
MAQAPSSRRSRFLVHFSVFSFCVTAAAQARAVQPLLPSIVHSDAAATLRAPPIPVLDSVSPGSPFGARQKVVIEDGAQFDYFGWAVAVDGDTALVGAYGVTVGGNEQQGTAYVFTKADGVWTLAATLTANDGQPFDIFGDAVALSGGVAAIGAYQADQSRGAVYVFTGSGTHWTQKARLAADDAANGDCLGWSIAVANQTVLAGAPFALFDGEQYGAVYAFSPNAGVWGETQKFTSVDAELGDFFGNAIAMDDKTAVIGADSKTVAGHVVQGAAYVFDGSNGSWVQEAKLTSDDGAPFDNFGRSVAVSGSTVLVGAPYAVVDDNAFQGAVYAFDGTGADWQQTAKLVASDGGPDGYFGWSVALSGDGALVGADAYDIQTPGKAYVLARSAGQWSETGVLASGDGAAVDFFGWSVALSGANAIVGEPFAVIGGHYAQGAAYFYDEPDDVIFADGFDAPPGD